MLGAAVLDCPADVVERFRKRKRTLKKMYNFKIRSTKMLNPPKIKQVNLH
jgi:hypothetical protein